MKLVVIAALLGLAYALPKRVNTHGYTFQQVVDKVIQDTDTNHDGLVSFVEFNVELLGQFDLDGDGAVTRNEFVQRWTARYGDNNADTHKFFDNIDSNHDHILNQADLTAQWSELNLSFGQLISAAAGTLTEITVAQFRHFIEVNHPHGHGHGKRANTHGFTFQQVVDKVIQDTDTNHDGLVSFVEFNVELLGQFDLDGDGAVTRNEFVQRWTARYGDNNADTHKFFDNIDSNHDHILNQADLTAQWSELNLSFGQLISAAAGTLTEITVAQFRHFIELNHPHGHGHGKRANTHGFTFQQVVDHVIKDTDTNNDGLVSFVEFNVELLGQFDLDGDGAVTRNEFVQRWTARYGDNNADTHKFFDNIDSNHDHILNQADLTAQWSELNLSFGQLISAAAGTLTEITVAQFRHFIEVNHPHGHGHGR